MPLANELRVSSKQYSYDIVLVYSFDLVWIETQRFSLNNIPNIHGTNEIT